jgi:signal transduction histidine kinase
MGKQMKLIKRTYIGTLLLSIPIIAVGSIFCFYIIRYINYEETDEYLTYEMERITEYYNEHTVLSEFNKIYEIQYNVRYEEPVFKDTLLLETGDNEYIPFRQLYFSINHKGEYHTIVLSHLLMGKDDIFEGTLLIIIGLVFFTFLFQILMIQLVNKKLWKPFYSTLSKLQTFRIDKTAPAFPGTDIDEFSALNKHLQSLLEKVTRDYRNNKEFNENASHELQTHLAVIRAKTEQLINKIDECPKELHEIYNASNKLSRIQKSLLLLSKISNSEFIDNRDVNIKEVVENTLFTYQEAFEIRNIRVETRLKSFIINIDKGLAEILINNLVKNATKHNINAGYIKIDLNENSLTIQNSGQAFSGNPNDLFQRFNKGENGNTGIGLAIVKQICDIYHFGISYNITGKVNHTITIIFQKK